MNSQFLYVNYDSINDENTARVAVSDPVLKKVSFVDIRTSTVYKTASINANRRDSISSAVGIQGFGPGGYRAYFAIDSDNPSSIIVYDQTGSLRTTLVGPGQMQGLKKNGTFSTFTSDLWTVCTSGSLSYTASVFNAFTQDFTSTPYSFDLGTTYSPTIELFVAYNGAATQQIYFNGIEQNKLIIYQYDGVTWTTPATEVGSCSFNSFGFGGGCVYADAQNVVLIGAFNSGTGNPEIWEFNPATYAVDYVYDLTFLKTNNNLTTASSLIYTTSPGGSNLYLVGSEGIFGWNAATRAFVCSQSYTICTASAYVETTPKSSSIYIPVVEFTGSANGGAVLYNNVS